MTDNNAPGDLPLPTHFHSDLEDEDTPEEVEAPKPRGRKKKVEAEEETAAAPAESGESSVSAPTAPASPRGQVVGGGKTDQVLLRRIVYKNNVMRKSLSVRHLQRRLAEWGFVEASADVEGYYGDLTEASVSKFQEHVGLQVTGRVDAETLRRLFENDMNVEVVL